MLEANNNIDNLIEEIGVIKGTTFCFNLNNTIIEAGISLDMLQYVFETTGESVNLNGPQSNLHGQKFKKK